MNHQPTSLKPAEFNRTVYRHAVEKGNDYTKDVLSPSYWVHVCNKLKEGDRIEVTGPENEYFAELYVATVSPMGARVLELVKVQVKANEVAAGEDVDPDYELKLKGPRKWTIVRKADGEVIQDGLPTRQDAASALATMRSSIAD